MGSWLPVLQSKSQGSVLIPSAPPTGRLSRSRGCPCPEAWQGPAKGLWGSGRWRSMNRTGFGAAVVCTPVLGCPLRSPRVCQCSPASIHRPFKGRMHIFPLAGMKGMVRVPREDSGTGPQFSFRVSTPDWDLRGRGQCHGSLGPILVPTDTCPCFPGHLSHSLLACDN